MHGLEPLSIVDTKQEASIQFVLRRSALTINAADRFGRVRASLLDRTRLWSDEAAAEGLNGLRLLSPTTSHVYASLPKIRYLENPEALWHYYRGDRHLICFYCLC
jgi:hypothetical protein